MGLGHPAQPRQFGPPFWLKREIEWRAIGVQQSCSWVHYAIHHPEPDIMLFRRPLNYQQQQENQAQQTMLAKYKNALDLVYCLDGVD
ncbi:Uncharacterized protein TCM_034772 [Theobroma cacao]|uniref:Cyclin-dependent kinases regulatory subunit n=1 Tax=Theobroma cacao TaxID=3641 RepID=A0A061FGI0_THECC|nr:Uncharacterized protein TCM_034772 [Theobroma cacao]